MSYPNEAGTQNAHLRYSLTDNSDLSLVNVFDKFVIESETNVLVLHLKDLFGSFLFYNCKCKLSTNFAFFLPWVNRKFAILGHKKFTGLLKNSKTVF